MISSRDKDVIQAILKKLEEQSDLRVRQARGYGVGHAFVDRKATNLGKSKVREKFEEEDLKTSNIKKITKRQPVSVSKAFKRRN